MKYESSRTNKKYYESDKIVQTVNSTQCRNHHFLLKADQFYMTLISVSDILVLVILGEITALLRP